MLIQFFDLQNQTEIDLYYMKIRLRMAKKINEDLISGINEFLSEPDQLSFLDENLEIEF